MLPGTAWRWRWGCKPRASSSSTPQRCGPRCRSARLLGFVASVFASRRSALAASPAGMLRYAVLCCAALCCVVMRWAGASLQHCLEVPCCPCCAWQHHIPTGGLNSLTRPAVYCCAALCCALLCAAHHRGGTEPDVRPAAAAALPDTADHPLQIPPIGGKSTGLFVLSWAFISENNALLLGLSCAKGRSTCVNLGFNLCSICVQLAFNLRSICVQLVPFR